MDVDRRERKRRRKERRRRGIMIQRRRSRSTFWVDQELGKEKEGKSGGRKSVESFSFGGLGVDCLGGKKDRSGLAGKVGDEFFELEGVSTQHQCPELVGMVCGLNTVDQLVHQEGDKVGTMRKSGRAW